MMLGKRKRGPMKRTTSMLGINVNMADVEGADPSDSSPIDTLLINSQDTPRNHRKNSAGISYAVEEMAEFLTKCGLCKRRLTPNRDIYIYRGDTAFCSQECRDQQMKRDEKKKCYTIISKKDENHHRAIFAATMSPEPYK